MQLLHHRYRVMFMTIYYLNWPISDTWTNCIEEKMLLLDVPSLVFQSALSILLSVLNPWVIFSFLLMDLRADCQQKWNVSLQSVSVFTFLLPLFFSSSAIFSSFLSINLVCLLFFCYVPASVFHLTLSHLGLLPHCVSPPSLVPVEFSPPPFFSPARIICSALFWALTGYCLLLCR